MFAKLANPRFLLDLRPLLPAAQAEALTVQTTADSFRRVFTMLIDQLPTCSRALQLIPSGAAHAVLADDYARMLADGMHAARR